MEHLHKLFVMAAGSVRWACSTFKSRVKKVMTEAKCDTTEARNSLFESNFDCNFAIRAVRDRNVKILLDQDFHARGELNVDSATELLERHVWQVSNTTALKPSRSFSMPSSGDTTCMLWIPVPSLIEWIGKSMMQLNCGNLRRCAPFAETHMMVTMSIRKLNSANVGNTCA